MPRELAAGDGLLLSFVAQRAAEPAIAKAARVQLQSERAKGYGVVDECAAGGLKMLHCRDGDLGALRKLTTRPLRMRAPEVKLLVEREI